MGPKAKGKKEKEGTTKKKKSFSFPVRERNSLKKTAKNRNCFSLIVLSEITEEVPGKDVKTFSAPNLPVRSTRISWPPLDIFTAVDDCEVPRVTIWRPFTKKQMKEIKSLDKQKAFVYFEKILPARYTDLNRRFIKTLLFDVLKWAKKRGLNYGKTSSVLGMYFNTHNYFLGSMWRNQTEVYNFFKESILLHTLNDPPKSAAILTPFECKDGLLYFCHTYMPMLPLLRVQLLPNYRLKLQIRKKNGETVLP